jgi:hypothetical protein
MRSPSRSPEKHHSSWKNSPSYWYPAPFTTTRSPRAIFDQFSGETVRSRITSPFAQLTRSRTKDIHEQSLRGPVKEFLCMVGKHSDDSVAEGYRAGGCLEARSIICRTCTCLHWPPLAVPTFRALSWLAMALRLRCPAACMSRMIGSTFAANCAACAMRATRMRSTAPAGSVFHEPWRLLEPPWYVLRWLPAHVRHDSSILAAFEALPFSRQSATARPVLWRRLSQG